MMKRSLLLLCSFLLFTGCASTASQAETERYTYQSVDTSFVNPLIGYMQNAEETQPYTEMALVYIDLTWRELEPERGIYDWDTIAAKNQLDRWRSEGKHGVLRFVCDVPGEEAHRDIPDWLYDETGDGMDYDIDYGKGYCPNYANAVFRQEHHRTLQEIGRYFSENYGDFVAYVELGSLGHWGEWHVKYSAGLPFLPKTEIRKEYVEAYAKAFPKARLLSRRSYVEMPEGTGIYNDVTGDEEETERLLRELAEGGASHSMNEEYVLKPLHEIWKTAPVGGEFTSGLPMEEMLSQNMEKTWELIEATHPSFLGPKIPDVRAEDGGLSETARKNARRIQNRLGYRYRVSELQISNKDNEERLWTGVYKRLTGQEEAWRRYKQVAITLQNDGLAPMYFDWPVVLYLVKEDDFTGTKRYPIEGLKLTEISENQSATSAVQIPAEELEAENVALYIGIEDPETGEPAVQLAMDAPEVKRMYRLK